VIIIGAVERSIMNSLLVWVGIPDRTAPGNDPGADAVTAEALGCGAVPAAGHPVRTYPTYETLTLLTWIAARTMRIGIMPRVLGVPFRRPAA
jgi:alkanesulfonate monooxygenase SsuD/methylene tetrahydromethanopterin reductase-like flavin-dependent oxidoreductase (luciferase family)